MRSGTSISRSRRGSSWLWVGPSGCGKSTLLRTIAGLERISGGTMRIAGDVVNGKAPRERDLAMVFQSYALYPHMMRCARTCPVRAAEAGMPEGRDRRAVEEAARIPSC
ncbi:ATP-binding cassette domain-containing protein [Novosphingobium sp. MW5]|nr:ATP-binding cassette domain-containing protein [Novosphingobium sp. MW5]